MSEKHIVLLRHVGQVYSVHYVKAVTLVYCAFVKPVICGSYCLFNTKARWSHRSRLQLKLGDINCWPFSPKLPGSTNCRFCLDSILWNGEEVIQEIVHWKVIFVLVMIVDLIVQRTRNVSRIFKNGIIPFWIECTYAPRLPDDGQFEAGISYTLLRVCFIILLAPHFISCLHFLKIYFIHFIISFPRLEL